MKDSTINIPDFIAKGFLSRELTEHANQIVRKLNGNPSVGSGPDLTGVISALKIHTPIEGGGKYVAQVIKGRYTLDNTQKFYVTDSRMVAASGLKAEHYVYLINLPEDETNSHTLSQDQFCMGMFIGMANDGFAIYLTDSVGKIASGKYPGTVRQVVAANTDGYDWIHLNSLLPNQD